MLNNPALDVAIGLVFIYAIYSLLATTLTELIASFFNLRGVFLLKGIRRMLLDKPKSSRQKRFTFEDETEKVDTLFNPSERLNVLFQQRPEIVYLGRRGIFNKKNRLPSYIKAKTFAKALYNVLESRMIRDKADNQGIPPLNQHIQKVNDSTKKIEDSDESSITIEFINGLIKDANEQGTNTREKIERFKKLAEEWYNETMERVSGWYKKRIQLITFFAGLVIAFSLNVDTIAIGKKLGKDEKARLAMVQAATSYSQSVVVKDSLDSNNQEKIKQLTANVDTLLKQTEAVESILESSRPDPLVFFKDKANRKPTWSYILGCFVTAIALSIGSPFWFDLLNKLVKLRGAGTQEKTTGSGLTNKAVG